MIEISGLVKDYSLKAGLVATLLGRQPVVRAIRGISLSIGDGEIVGLVGESGCGKTTTGKVLARLEEPTAGSITVNGQELAALRGASMRRFRRDIQMIFQDPYDSLNSRYKVIDIVTHPLRYLGLGTSPQERAARAHEALQQVELSPPESFAQRYPHQLSGGQRQRVAIARALVVKPQFIVADEPVSMLDVSVRAGVLNLLQRLNDDLGISMLFITHDLASARYLCHRVAVMYLGEIVEMATTEELISAPKHPYSRLLLAAAPDLFRPHRERLAARGDIADASAPITGCQFAPRCPYAQDRCRVEPPRLRTLEGGQAVACHFAEQIDLQEQSGVGIGERRSEDAASPAAFAERTASD